MARTVILLVAWVSMLLPGCGTGEMKEYVDSKERFKVLLPGDPKISTEKAEGVPIRMILAQTNRGGYVVVVNPFPQGPVAERDVERVLDHAAKGALKKKGAVILLETSLKLDETYPGRETVAEITAPDKGKIRIRHYLVGERMFQLIANGTAAFVDGEDTRKFFDSFQLTGS